MFTVGRYDPRVEDAKKNEVGPSRGAPLKAEKKSRDQSGAKKKRLQGRRHQQPELKEQHPTERSPTSTEDHALSESVESSSLSEFSSNEEPESSLKVIAPKQSAPVAGIKRQRAGLTDEGLDDFDADERVGRESGAPTGLTDQQRRHRAEISIALQMSALPIRDAAKIWNLAPFLVDNLERDKYTNFFPIQSLVIPDVISSERHSQMRVRDVCISSPTGSGKTLSFVIPVLNALSSRIVCRLRALVVLPSRDLATQVFKVFKRYAEGSKLRVGLAIGQTDFEAEQKVLTLGVTGTRIRTGDSDAALLRHSFNPTNPKFAVEAFSGLVGCSSGEPLSSRVGGWSAVDILVATPGRLIDHLDKTDGFTLQHLRFLIIDEADRLLNQSYQGWIHRVTTAASPPPTLSKFQDGLNGTDQEALPRLQISKERTSFVLDPITWRKSMIDSESSIASLTSCPIPLRKMLFSATMTKDPQRLASVGLFNPKYFDAHHLKMKTVGEASDQSNREDRKDARDGLPSLSPKQRYSVPDSLLEHRVECTAKQKPVVLLALLFEQLAKPGNSMVVVFTSSLDSTHRLARLLQLLWRATGYGPTASVAEFSSALNQRQRSKLMKRCISSHHKTDETNGKPVNVVVCSDGMSRGMDLPNISAVINYDVPRFAKTYVHRCGRTARAGKRGAAISLLKGGQVGEFLKMRKLIEDPERVEKARLKKDLVSDAMKVYGECVKALRRVIEAEENGELDPVAALVDEWAPRLTGIGDDEGSIGNTDDNDEMFEEDVDALLEGEN